MNTSTVALIDDYARLIAQFYPYKWSAEQILKERLPAYLEHKNRWLMSSEEPMTEAIRQSIEKSELDFLLETERKLHERRLRNRITIHHGLLMLALDISFSQSLKIGHSLGLAAYEAEMYYQGEAAFQD